MGRQTGKRTSITALTLMLVMLAPMSVMAAPAAGNSGNLTYEPTKNIVAEKAKILTETYGTTSV